VKKISLPRTRRKRIGPKQAIEQWKKKKPTRPSTEAKTPDLQKKAWPAENLGKKGTSGTWGETWPKGYRAQGVETQHRKLSAPRGLGRRPLGRSGMASRARRLNAQQRSEQVEKKSTTSTIGVTLTRQGLIVHHHSHRLRQQPRRAPAARPPNPQLRVGSKAQSESDLYAI